MALNSSNTNQATNLNERWGMDYAYARQAPSADTLILHEVRSLTELGSRMNERRYQLLFVEVTADNFETVLTWLAEQASWHPAVRTIALVSGDDAQRSQAGRPREHSDLADIEFSLFEAGACEIARSPRRLQHILAFAQQHAASHTSRADELSACESFADWAWAQLPWQTA
jgi:hypothetical protein